jgi:hypothetical protein
MYIIANNTEFGQNATSILVEAGIPIVDKRTIIQQGITIFVGKSILQHREPDCP